MNDSDDSSAETSGTCGENLTWTLDGTSLTISGTGAMTDYAFNSSSPWGKSITSVSIGNSVTSIGGYAFRGCTSLASIAIPDSVKSIGNGAFYGCTSLASIAIPDSVKSIGYGAFSGCTSLTSVAIPDSVTSIGSHAFSGCTSLASIAIPDSVTSIGGYAFYGCTDLRELTIPISLNAVGSNSYPLFSGCTGLQKVTFTKGTGEGYVYGTSSSSSNYYQYTPWYLGRDSLTEVTFEYGITSIGSGAFYKCTGLTSVSIPGSVTSIGSGAFSGCTSLASIAIPDSVTSIGGYAFYGCTSLASIAIPDSVTSIGDEAFRGCTSLTSVAIPDSVTSIGYGAFSGCTSLTSVAIPDSVTSIGGSAFYGCTSLASVTIGNSVTSIGGSAFYECTSLASIAIPDSVTSIGGYAFYGCTSLASIAIPDSVTSIGSGAFSGCTSLASIAIPDSVTSIGYYAFYGCTSLASIAIPDSVTSIGSGAFRECTSLASVTIGNSVTSIGGDAFYGCIFYDVYGNTLTHIASNLKGHLFHGSDCESLVMSESHTVVNDDAVVPTCTEAGHTANTYCSVCGVVLSHNETIPALGHDLIHHDARAPTSSEVGWEAYDTCSRCDYTTYVEIPRLGYSIRFMNGEEVFREYVLVEGESVSAPVEIPVKNADKSYTYSFSGWDGYVTGMTVSDDVDFVAVYAATPIIYSIMFKLDGDTTISSIDARYGDAVNIPVATKDSTAQYDYSFRAWMDSDGNDIAIPSTVQGDLTAYASFTQTDREYMITFLDGDSEYARYVLYYGNTVVRPAVDPTKASDDNFDYTFFGWEGYTDGMKVTKTESFPSIFLKTVRVSANTDGAYNVNISDSSASFTADTVSEIVEQAKSNSEVTMSVSLGGGVITFDNTALQALEEEGSDLVINRLDKSQMTSDVRSIVGDNVAYSITFGSNKTFGNGKVTVTVPYTLDSGRDADKLMIYYIADGRVAEEISCLYNDGYVTFVTDHFSTYAVMYIDPGSEQEIPIMYFAIGGVAVLALAGGAIALKRRH